jgi:hypothetical protein
MLVKSEQVSKAGVGRRASNMTRFVKYSAIALLAFLTFVPAASARGMYFGGGYGGGYVGGGFGPGFYPGGYYGYGPWYGQGYSQVGEVQILTKQKGNQIFVDGGFAGRTGELKKFSLRTGTHTIELRNVKGQSYYKEQINVISGKKLKIQSDYIN